MRTAEMSGGDAERFAAAVAHGTTPGAIGDAELARDLEMVEALRSLGGALDPAPDAKARARQRAMAAFAAEHGSAVERTAPIFTPVATAATDVEETARIAPVAADPQPTHTLPGGRGARRARHSLPGRPAGRSGTARPAARSLRRRSAVVAASALAALIAITTGGVFASRDALPGDGLYAMKQAAESAGVAFTFDDAGKAARYLEIASIRMDEVEKLAAHDTPDPQLLGAALAEFTAATGDGARLLLANPEATAKLAELRTWATAQANRLEDLRTELPAATDPPAERATDLLERLTARIAAVQAQESCGATGSGLVDDLGPVPADAVCTPQTVPQDEPSTAVTTTPDADAATTTEPGTPDATTPPTAQANPSTGAPRPSSGPSTSGGGLLPIDPEDLPLGGGSGAPAPSGQRSRATTATATPSTGSGDGVAVPLPLPAPITLPPLLPGLPGITIG